MSLNRLELSQYMSKHAINDYLRVFNTYYGMFVQMLNGMFTLKGANSSLFKLMYWPLIAFLIKRGK